MVEVLTEHNRELRSLILRRKPAEEMRFQKSVKIPTQTAYAPPNPSFRTNQSLVQNQIFCTKTGEGKSVVRFFERGLEILDEKTDFDF